MTDMATDTSSEEWRHQCEVRHVLKLGTMQAMKDYLDKVKTKRKPAAYEKLAADVRAEIQKQRGNR